MQYKRLTKDVIAKTKNQMAVTVVIDFVRNLKGGEEVTVYADSEAEAIPLAIVQALHSKGHSNATVENISSRDTTLVNEVFYVYEYFDEDDGVLDEIHALASVRSSDVILLLTWDTKGETWQVHYLPAVLQDYKRGVDYESLTEFVLPPAFMNGSLFAMLAFEEMLDREAFNAPLTEKTIEDWEKEYRPYYVQDGEVEMLAELDANHASTMENSRQIWSEISWNSHDYITAGYRAGAIRYFITAIKFIEEHRGIQYLSR